jgi:hypothetical protein
VYIGIAFIIAAIVVILISTGTTSNIGTTLQQTLIVNNLTIKSGEIASTPININANSFVFAFITLTKPANIYFFNNSAYKIWINETNTTNSPTGLKNAENLEGAGALIIYRNTTNATIPTNLGSVNSSLLYSTNQSQLYPKGTYDFVIDNSNGSASRSSNFAAKVAYLPPFTNGSLSSGPLAQLGSQIDQEVVYGVLFFLLFVAGIIIVIYGLIKEPKDKQASVPKNDQPQKLETKADQQYVDELYKKVDAKKKRKKRTRN